jgi:hypothetical protein
MINATTQAERKRANADYIGMDRAIPDTLRAEIAFLNVEVR